VTRFRKMFPPDTLRCVFCYRVARSASVLNCAYMEGSRNTLQCCGYWPPVTAQAAGSLPASYGQQLVIFIHFRQWPLKVIRAPRCPWGLADDTPQVADARSPRRPCIPWRPLISSPTSASPGAVARIRTRSSRRVGKNKLPGHFKSPKSWVKPLSWSGTLPCGRHPTALRRRTIRYEQATHA
jgi:hypothetical protein